MKSRVSRAQALVHEIRNTFQRWSWYENYAVQEFNSALPDLVRLLAVAEALPSQCFKAQFTGLVLEPISSDGPPPRTVCARALAVCDWLEDTIKDFGDNPLMWDGTSLTGQSTKSAQTKERDSLLKLVLGMAIRKYGFLPNGTGGKAPKDIVDDLALVPMRIDVATVRKYLNEVDLLPRNATV
jgi:hypothetical protein